SQPTDDYADQRQQSNHGGPESPRGHAVNRGRGWLGNLGGHQHGMHKPPEQRGCSQGGENKNEGSFHRLSPFSKNGSVSVLERSIPGRTRQGRGGLKSSIGLPSGSWI